MKNIEVFDSDYDALEILAKVHGGDLKATVSDLVNIGIKTYAAQIAAWRQAQDVTEPRDENYEKALALVKVKGKISCSEIQRTLLVSYGTAEGILTRMINDGVVVQGATKSSWILAEAGSQRNE